MNYLTSITLKKFIGLSLFSLLFVFTNCKKDDEEQVTKSGIPEGGTCGTCPACAAAGSVKTPPRGQHETCTDCPLAEPGEYSATIGFSTVSPFIQIFPPGSPSQIKKGDAFFGLGDIENGRITLTKGAPGKGTLAVKVDDNVSLSIALKDVVLEGENISSFNLDASKSTVSYNYPSFDHEGLKSVIGSFVKTYTFNFVEVDGIRSNEDRTSRSKFYGRYNLVYDIPFEDAQSLMRIFGKNTQRYHRCVLAQQTTPRQWDVRDPVEGEVVPMFDTVINRIRLQFKDIKKL